MKPDAYPPTSWTSSAASSRAASFTLNMGDGKFAQVGAETTASVGWAHARLADLDGDGFLDVYATAGYRGTAQTGWVKL